MAIPAVACFQFQCDTFYHSWPEEVRADGEAAQDGMRDGSFRAVRELVEAIRDYLSARHEEPKKYVWRAQGEQILRKIQAARGKKA